VLGNSCALELARSGRRTLSIDLHSNAGYGSSSSSSSIIRVFYSALDSCKLAWEGYWGWQNWRDHLQAPQQEQVASFRKTGSLALQAREDDVFIKRVQASLQTLGIEHELLDHSELQRRLPFMSLDSYSPPRRIDDPQFGEASGKLIGGLYSPFAGYMDDPQLAARNLADAAARYGAAFKFGTEVTAVTYNRAGTAITGVVLSDGTAIEAPVVVNAAGPHSSLVHQMAFKGCQVDDDSLVHSKPLRVEVAVLPAPRDADLDGSLPFVADNDLGIYCRPHFPNQLLVGGAEPECDPHHFLEHPDHLHDGLDEDWTNYVYRAATRIPSLPIPNGPRGLAAIYDVSDDWLPIYDKSSLQGWYNLRGTSGNQFKNAPVVGKLLREIIEACESHDNHDAQPVQLHLQHTGQQLNCGVFSRLRKQSNTSGTVFG